MSNGKGSKQRPVDIDKFRKNYDNVFGKGKLKVDVDKLTNAIKLETISHETRSKRKVKVIKEYTDSNGVEMIIININDSLTNRIIPKALYTTLERECAAAADTTGNDED